MAVLPGSAPARAQGLPRSGVLTRQRRALTSEDRSTIAVALLCGCTYQEIGDLIGRDKSVVWREANWSSGPDGSYRGPAAHRPAHERRRRHKESKLSQNPGLCRWIEDKTVDGWSPRLIGQVLRRDHPSSSMDRVGHETIYRRCTCRAAASCARTCTAS